MIKKLRTRFEHIDIARHLLKWTIFVTPVSFLAGSLVALFPWLPENAVNYRLNHPWILFFLPLAGIFIYFLYKLLGKNAEAGNNLIMDEIHEPGGSVPARMALPRHFFTSQRSVPCKNNCIKETAFLNIK